LQNELQKNESSFEIYKNPNSTDKSSSAEKRGKRILLIEDSEPAIIQTTDILLDKGYLITAARSGKEALNLIDKVLPDGIILDLTMPEMDGFQVLKAIRDMEKFAHVPVLILSAKHITRDELSFLKSNHVYQLIQKGAVDKKELLAAIEGLVSGESVKTAEAQKKHIRAEGEKPVILVVEDNPDNMITVEALLKEDFIVAKATDGKTGVEQAGKVKPSLVLMDISLPGMNGFEAFSKIKATPELKHIPIVAMTASAMAGNKEEILAYGFDGYISKPIDMNEMEEIVWRCLNGK